MSTKILIPTDFSEVSGRALEYAAFLSQYLNSKLVCLYLVDPKEYRSKEEYQHDVDNLLEAKLKDVLCQVKSINPDLKKINLELSALTASVTTEIINYARKESFDYIVMGSEGFSVEDDWLDRFKGTTAYQVIHRAPCPVFTFIGNQNLNHIRRMLVPLDLSEGTRQKIPQVTQLALATGATVYLLSVYPDSRDDNWMQLESQIKEVARQLRKSGVMVQYQLKERDDFPGAVLSHSYDIDADLIAIMTRPSTQWNELFVTPGAKRIIAHADVPVLAIRPTKKEDIGL